MKIVYFSWEFPPRIVGGLGTFTMEMARQLVMMGNEVTVFTMNEENKLMTTDNWKGVEVHRPELVDFTDMLSLFVDYDLRGWGPNIKFFTDVLTYNMLSATKLVNLMVGREERKFDIIDAHDWLGIFGASAVKKELGIPLIFHLHSTEKGRSRGKGSRTVEDFEYRGGEIADCIITVSNAMEDELVKLGFPQEKIRVCWNGVDAEKYDPRNVSSSERDAIRERYGIGEDNMLLFVGRLIEVKGPDNLVKAMPSILEVFPNTKLVLLGVGYLEEEIRRLIKTLKLEEKVILRSEFVSEEERIQHYAASNVVVFPSLYEPFGIVCTEAMSMSKPVVVGARGTSGMREQVVAKGPDQCGVHINPYDPDDIAWGVKEVLRSDMRKMGENARKRVLENFTWEISAKKTFDIYKEFAE